MSHKVQVSLPSYDQIMLEWEGDHSQVDSFKLTGVGCNRLLEMLQYYRKAINKQWALVPMPTQNDHVSLLFRELFLKAQNKWSPPYKDLELCHCRVVPTEKVMNSIRSGAHTPQEVSEQTTASTSCGTCRKDVIALIEYMTHK